MLILTRKPGESLYIGDNIKITVVELKGHQVRVGIDAPTDLRIYREEIYLQILEENRKAAESGAASDAALDDLAAAWGGRRSDGEDSGKKGRLPGLAAVSFDRAKAPGAAPQVVVKRRKKEEQ